MPVIVVLAQVVPEITLCITPATEVHRVAHLVIREGPDAAKKGTLVPVGDVALLIGRGTDCNLSISDEGLSRRHAEIARQGGDVVVRDVGSSNGTYVNSVRVTAGQALCHGDVIVMGLTTIAFEDPEAIARLDTVDTSRSRKAASALLPPPLPPPPPAAPTPIAPPPPPGPVLPQPGVAAPLPAASRPARKSGRRLLSCCGCFVFVLLVAAAGTGIWWKYGERLREVVERRGSATEEQRSEPELIAMDFGIAKASPIEVARGTELAATSISAKSGGTIATADGLTIDIPSGAFASDRNIRVFAARVPPPSEKIALIGGGEAQLVPLKAWDVDAGPDDGLFDAEVEVKVRCDKGQVPLYAAISVDGKRWTKVPATIDGENVTFRTRHFSPVTILGLSQAAAVVLPIVAVTYIVVERAEELPSMFHADAPFVSVDVNPPGFEIYWSTKLDGVDPKTGFLDEAGYKRELEKTAKNYTDIGGGGTTGAASFNAEVAALKKKHLMPAAVREIEEALVYAQGYLKSRKIDSPALSLPVYVVPSLGGTAGEVNNPWSGRRYMLMDARSQQGVVWATALHELFHHYQMGYVWVDRTSHLPFVEASALLMEREAKPDYLAAKKPFNTVESLAVSQMVVYRNGFDGPKEWKEEYVRLHGYGMTWFLEYLRDECYVGVLKTNDPRAFHAELLGQWRRRWTGAMHKGFQWAAGGDASLGVAWIDFAKNFVLKGPVDDCGSRTPYGAKYGSCPLSDSPYADKAKAYGLPAGSIDLRTNAVRTLTDADVAAWSIQFYEILPPQRSKVSVVVKAPRAWFPKKGKSRALFVREGRAADVESILDADAAPPSSPDAYAVLPTPGEPVYAYVVDTGQTGSGWLSDNAPATVFVLEPPQDVKSSVSGARQKLTWTAPAAASENGLITGYLVYVVGEMEPRGFVKLADTSYELDVEGSAKAIELTSAIEVGKGEDGAPLYIESERSEPVGFAAKGNYEMCLDLFPETPKTGDSCDSLQPSPMRPSFKVCFDVKVQPDGRFTFSHQWTGIEGASQEPMGQSISGRGTFVGDKLKMDAKFRIESKWTLNRNKYEQTDTGTVSGEGKYVQNIWFGQKLEGRFDSSFREQRCTREKDGVCEKYENHSSSCSGRYPPVLSSIEKFERK